MAWTEIMTSARAALARAEWAIEAGNPDVALQELRIATAQAMLVWLRAHDPSAPVWLGYAPVLLDFGAVAQSGPGPRATTIFKRQRKKVIQRIKSQEGTGPKGAWP